MSYFFFPCKASKSGLYISLWESLVSGAQCPCGTSGYHKAPETSGRGPCAAWLWLPWIEAGAAWGLRDLPAEVGETPTVVQNRARWLLMTSEACLTLRLQEPSRPGKGSLVRRGSCKDAIFLCP